MRFPILLVLFSLICSIISSFSQDDTHRRHHPHEPILFRPQSHDPNFRDFPQKSFYESRNNWQDIIDSTWGPGLPLHEKQNLFTQYANILHDKFDGFLSLGMDWQDWYALRDSFFQRIDSTTSRGGFCALMNYFSFHFKDCHTLALDEQIFLNTPLNPGTPVLFAASFITVEHSGVVVTVLADSSVLVLRVMPNHPLGLQPGDIIFGYDGVPYQTAIRELMQAELPGWLPWVGAESAVFHSMMMGALMNWHLFNSIDILKYSTGIIVNLPTAPMISLNIPPMLNNEQIDIPGIPFPDYFNGDIVSYGTLQNTNIGYIYLFSEWPQSEADQQFYQAVNALKNTEGLIIDMRWNEGGWALFDDAFRILFNESPYTLNGANRENPSTLTLIPNNYSGTYSIKGNPSSLYDHPIAVLLGPNCGSMGDITAHRFRYHPMVRFFGKPSVASFGHNDFVNFPDWYLRYSLEDDYHVNQPGIYLNRSEFPIDFPVWHNPSDVANGVDAVVETALNWLNSMIYAHNVKPNSSFINPIIDSLNITANVKNPHNHNIAVAAIINTLSSVFVDSLPMYDDGNHGDSLAGDDLYGCYSNQFTDENIFIIDASVTDLDSNHYHKLAHATCFTTVGPVVINHYVFPYVDTNLVRVKFYLKNESSVDTVTDIVAEMTTNDSNVTFIGYNNQNFGNIAPGEIKSATYNVITQSYPDSVDLEVHISSAGRIFWNDSIKDKADTTTGIALKAPEIPQQFSLKQNYPNPFNPTTTIEFDLPKTSEVSLKVFNILGEEVATLVSDRLSAGSYSYEWDASQLASGVYLYRLKVGDYVETRKMVVMK
jgi:hypothetical protein